MSTSTNVQKLNRELAQKLAKEGRNNPHHMYAGKFVGIANGQVVAVVDNLRDLYRKLREIEPDPTKCFGVEVGRDYEQVHEIWELCQCVVRSGR